MLRADFLNKFHSIARAADPVQAKRHQTAGDCSAGHSHAHAPAEVFRDRAGLFRGQALSLREWNEHALRAVVMDIRVLTKLVASLHYFVHNFIHNSDPPLRRLRNNYQSIEA